MKKRFFLIFVILLLAAVFLPLSPKMSASALSYDGVVQDDELGNNIILGGEKIELKGESTSQKADDGTWSVSYVGTKNMEGSGEARPVYKLTLNNYTCDDKAVCGKFVQDKSQIEKTEGKDEKNRPLIFTAHLYVPERILLKIELIGENTLGSTTGDYKGTDRNRRVGIYAYDSNVEVTGSGDLTINSYQQPFYGSTVIFSGSGSVTCNSHMDGPHVSYLSIYKGATLNINQNGSESAYRGLRADYEIKVKGKLNVESNATEIDSGYSKGCGIYVLGSLVADGGSIKVNHQGYNKNTSNLAGYAINVQNLEAKNGASVYAYNDTKGKDEKKIGMYGIRITRSVSASEKDSTGILTVDESSKVTGITTNETYGGIYAENKIVTTDSDGKTTAVISTPAGGTWNSTNYQICGSDGTPAPIAIISGLEVTPIYLIEDGGRKYWGYSSEGPWNEYTGEFVIGDSPTLTQDYFPAAYTVVNGTHTITLNNCNIAPNKASQEPFLTLGNNNDNSDVSVTLKLKGYSYVCSNDDRGVIMANDASDSHTRRLTIVNGGGDGKSSDDPIGSLTIDALSSNAAAVHGNDLDVVINSGYVCAMAKNGAAFGGAKPGSLTDSNWKTLKSLTINGGVIEATSENSPAVGPATSSLAHNFTGKFTMNGGTMTAKSTNSKYAIGGSYGMSSIIIISSSYGTCADNKIVINGGSLKTEGKDKNTTIGPSKDGSDWAVIKNSSGKEVYLTTINLVGTDDASKYYWKKFTYAYTYLENYKSYAYVGKKSAKSDIKVTDFNVTVYDSDTEKYVTYYASGTDEYGLTDLYGDTLHVYLPEEAYSNSAKVDGIKEGADLSRFTPDLGSDIKTTKDGSTTGTMYRQYNVYDTCSGTLAFREVTKNGSTVKQYCTDYNEKSADDQAWITYDIKNDGKDSITSFALKSENGDTQENMSILVLSGTHDVELDSFNVSNSEMPPIRVKKGTLNLSLSTDADSSNTLTYSGTGAVIELGSTSDSDKDTDANLVISGGGILNLNCANGSGIMKVTGAANNANVTVNNGRIYINAKEYGIKADTINMTDGTLNIIGVTDEKNYLDGKLNITGGSVQGSSSDSAEGSDEKSIKLKTYTVDGIKEIAKIDAIVFDPGTYAYNSTSLYTDSNGKLYIWLPSDTEVYSVKIGEKIYYRDGDSGMLRTATAPAFTAPAENAKAYVKSPGGSVTLSATATGISKINYKWQQSTDGSTWTDISVFADSSAYTVTNATEAMNGYKYRCVAANAGGTTYSNPVTLQVNFAARIIAHPQSVTKKVGDKASFSVTAEGRPDVSYQWQISTNNGGSWDDISGATGSTYTTDTLSENMNAYQYRCIVSNDIGTGTNLGSDTKTVTSQAATLTVNFPVRIKTEPSDTIVKEGEKATFTVEVEGRPAAFTYQWQVDKNDGNGFVNIDGACSATYEAANVTRDMNDRKYRCIVTNDAGTGTGSGSDVRTATSSTAVLTVYYGAEITQNPQDVSVIEGDRFTFTAAAAGRPADFTYQWQVDKNDEAGYTNIEGATSQSYSDVASDAEADGWKYRCIVSNDIGLDGVSDVKEAYSDAAVLGVTKAYANISRTPKDDRTVGTSITYAVDTNITDPVYTWYVTLSGESKSAVIDGEIGTNILNFDLEKTGTYKVWCVVTGGDDGDGVSITTDKDYIKSYRATVELSFPFKDVSDSDWFYGDVSYVYIRNLMTGTSSDTFSPYLTTNRAMVVTVLWRMEKSPAASGNTTFEDVAAGEWYSEAVAWATENGIVNGYGDGRFGPTDSVTREQLVAILWRYANMKNYNVYPYESTSLESYSDANAVSSYADKAMRWAVGSGVIKGSDSMLNPAGYATRAEIAAMLHRFT